MSENKSLLKKSLIYGIGTFGSKVLIFLLIPIYSYFINKEGFGYYDLVNSSMNLIIPFVTFQISDSLFRWLIDKKEDLSKAQTSVTNGFIVLSVGIVAIIVLSVLLYLVKPLQYQFWITVMFITAMIYPFLQQLIRGLGNSKLFATNGVVYSFIYVIANVVFVIILKMEIEGIFISTIVAFLLSSFLIICKINFNHYLNFKLIDKNEIVDMIRYSLPLVPNTISWWLVNSANKYIILFFLGVSANGLFAMSNRFPAILVMINQIFTLAWQEQAIVDFEKKDASANAAVLKFLIKTQFSLVIILSLLSKLFVDHLLSSEYADSWKYMPFLYLSSAFNSLAAYYGAFYLGAKKTKIIFTTTIYGGLVSIILGVLLVKPFGLMGVAFATLAGYVVLYLIRKITIKRITLISATGNTLLIYGGMVIASFTVTYFQNNLINLVALIIILGYIAFDNKRELTQLYNKVLTLRKKK